MAKWFSGNGFASEARATLCSICVPTVTVDSATAASPAAAKPGSGSGAVPIGDISGVRKDGSIIVTASGNTASDSRSELPRRA
jgi:hypothetical protein